MSAIVTLNPDHAVWVTEPTATDHGWVMAIRVPGGFWAVKVRPRDGGFAVFAEPRRGTVVEPFDIATSPDRQAAVSLGIGWVNSATIAVGRLDRVVFAGFGNATEETPLAVTR